MPPLTKAGMTLSIGITRARDLRNRQAMSDLGNPRHASGVIHFRQHDQ